MPHFEFEVTLRQIVSETDGGINNDISRTRSGGITGVEMSISQARPMIEYQLKRTIKNVIADLEAAVGYG